MTQQQWLSECIRRVKINEGCRLIAYPDPLSGGDPFTIGYGQTGPDIKVGTTWTQIQADHALINAINYTYIPQARASLAPGVFDALSDARRFVVVDIVYNMGAGSDGWGGFGATHALLAAAVHTKVPATAHALYGEVADHLAASAWATQVGIRALRDEAMMRSSNWCDANGDGSDVL